MWRIYRCARPTGQDDSIDRIDRSIPPYLLLASPCHATHPCARRTHHGQRRSRTRWHEASSSCARARDRGRRTSVRAGGERETAGSRRGSGSRERGGRACGVAGAGRAARSAVSRAGVTPIDPAVGVAAVERSRAIELSYRNVRAPAASRSTLSCWSLTKRTYA